MTTWEKPRKRSRIRCSCRKALGVLHEPHRRLGLEDDYVHLAGDGPEIAVEEQTRILSAAEIEGVANVEVARARIRYLVAVRPRADAKLAPECMIEVRNIGEAD